MRFKKSPQNNPFWIGVASFFGGISQDMMLPLLPLYFTNVLHLNKAFIGLIDGMVMGSATVFKIFAGYLSDRLAQRKSIILIGYALSWISRPLLVITGSRAAVLAARSLDGIGKGIKDSPKEALVADSAPFATRGKEFGIVRALDTFGSVVGPLIAAALALLLRTSDYYYQIIFCATTLPLAVTLYLIANYVVEVPRAQTRETHEHVTLPTAYYWFVGISVIFALGNFSDAFFILRVQTAGMSTVSIPLLYAAFNVVYAGMAVPCGVLSDRIGRIKMLMLGWTLFIAIHLALVVVTTTLYVMILFVLYGLYYAMTFGAARACIADFVPPSARGRAYGFYNALIGLAALPASYLAGKLWDLYGAAAPFLLGASCAGVALVLLVIFAMNYRLPLQQ